MLPELRATIAQERTGSYVTLTGQVPHEEVAAYFSSADIGVAPDPKNPMNDSSTMIKIFEYMAFRLPIVQYDLKEGRRVAGPAALYADAQRPCRFRQPGNQTARLQGTSSGTGSVRSHAD